MSKIDVIRAWKDEEYRSGLSKADLEKLPEHPAGWIELGDKELKMVAGGRFISRGRCKTINEKCTG